MGQLPFLNDTSLSHCIWLTCLLPGNRGKAGSCGGMIWYELKLFPNRLHRVWSCPLPVWWNLSPSINQYYITSGLFPSCVSFIVCSFQYNVLKTITMVLYFAWLCGWRCPGHTTCGQPRGGLYNSFPMQCCIAQVSWGSGLSVSFFIGIQPQVSGQRERPKTARGNDLAVCSTWRWKVVSFCSFNHSNVVCGLMGKHTGFFSLCYNLVLSFIWRAKTFSVSTFRLFLASFPGLCLFSANKKRGFGLQDGALKVETCTDIQASQTTYPNCFSFPWLFLSRHHNV